MTGRTHYTSSGKRSHHRKGRSRKRPRLSDEFAPKRSKPRPMAAKSTASLAELVEAYQNKELYADRILAKVLLGALADGFTRRDIVQKGWSGLRSPEGVQQGLNYLVDRGLLRRTRLKTRGRDKTIYTLEPAAPGGARG